MNTITDISAEQISDSRGKPALRVSIMCGDRGASFAVPAGASTGSREAHVLKDEDGGMGAAISAIRESIAPALRGMNVEDQRAIDSRMLELDGTAQKTKLGGNSMIGVSIAAAKAAAAAKGVPVFAHLRTLADIGASRTIPFLYMNYINGGKHATSPLAFQEHMIVPQAASVSEALDIAAAVQNRLTLVIQDEFGPQAAQSMGDEGGFVLPIADIEKPFDLLMRAIRDAGHEGRVKIAIDAAASSFYTDGIYRAGGRSLSATELTDIYRELSAKYPIMSIEDPFQEDAFGDFTALQATIDTPLVGDDLTVTNARSIEDAAGKRAIRAVIIKPNQAGTLSETLDAMRAARTHSIDCIVSHRSGETDDDFIADLAYAFGAFGLKAGALRKKERVVKYERLKTIAV